MILIHPSSRFTHSSSPHHTHLSPCMLSLLIHALSVNLSAHFSGHTSPRSSRLKFQSHAQNSGFDHFSRACISSTPEVSFTTTSSMYIAITTHSLSHVHTPDQLISSFPPRMSLSWSISASRKSMIYNLQRLSIATWLTAHPKYASSLLLLFSLTPLSSTYPPNAPKECPTTPENPTYGLWGLPFSKY